MRTNSFPRFFRHLTATVVLIWSFATALSAQNYTPEYSVRGGVAYYHNRPMRYADVHTFTILGHGYAKDRFNVYLNGQILAYVDPAFFRLKASGHQLSPGDELIQKEPYVTTDYFKTSTGVFFRGRKIKSADADSFQDLGDGYARDTFRAFFMGEQMTGVNSDALQTLGQGYAKDTFRVYYFGHRIEGANPDSFKILRDGYAEDTFHTYYRGQRVSD